MLADLASGEGTLLGSQSTFFLYPHVVGGVRVQKLLIMCNKQGGEGGKNIGPNRVMSSEFSIYVSFQCT